MINVDSNLIAVGFQMKLILGKFGLGRNLYVWVSSYNNINTAHQLLVMLEKERGFFLLTEITN